MTQTVSTTHPYLDDEGYEWLVVLTWTWVVDRCEPVGIRLLSDPADPRVVNTKIMRGAFGALIEVVGAARALAIPQDPCLGLICPNGLHCSVIADTGTRPGAVGRPHQDDDGQAGGAGSGG